MISVYRAVCAYRRRQKIRHMGRPGAHGGARSNLKKQQSSANVESSAIAERSTRAHLKNQLQDYALALDELKDDLRTPAPADKREEAHRKCTGAEFLRADSSHLLSKSLVCSCSDDCQWDPASHESESSRVLHTKEVPWNREHRP